MPHSGDNKSINRKCPSYDIYGWICHILGAMKVLTGSAPVMIYIVGYHILRAMQVSTGSAPVMIYMVGYHILRAMQVSTGSAPKMIYMTGSATFWGQRKYLQEVLQL